METMELNQDQKVFVQKQINQLHDATSHLNTLIKEPKLDKTNIHTILSCLEYYITDINKKLGYDLHLVKQMEERSIEIRAKNIEITKLKNRLGKSNLNNVAENAKVIIDYITGYWKDLGFCLVEAHINQYGNIKCEMSCSIDFYESTFTETPVSDRQEKLLKLEEMRKSFDIHYEDKSSHYPCLIDNEKNRKLILAYLKEEFPSARICRYESSSINRSEYFQIRKIHTYIDVVDVIELIK